MRLRDGIGKLTMSCSPELYASFKPQSTESTINPNQVLSVAQSKSRARVGLFKHPQNVLLYDLANMWKLAASSYGLAANRLACPCVSATPQAVNCLAGPGRASPSCKPYVLRLPFSSCPRSFGKLTAALISSADELLFCCTTANFALSRQTTIRSQW